MGVVRAIRKALLILLVLSVVAFAEYNTYIAHRWEDYDWRSYNPFLDHVSNQDVWLCQYPYAFDFPLVSMRLENISDYDLATHGGISELNLVKNARGARTRALNLREPCVDAIDKTQKCLEDNGFLFDVSYALLAATEDAEFARLNPFSVALIVWGAREEMECGIYQQSVIDNCGGYFTEWQATMSNATNALASSMDAVDDNYTAARETFDELKQAGMCDSDYTAAGHDACLDVQQGFSFIDSNTTTGTYGAYNGAHAGLDVIREQTGEDVPDMSNYSQAMNLIWKKDGAIDMLNGLRMNATQAKNDSENCTRLPLTAQELRWAQCQKR